MFDSRTHGKRLRFNSDAATQKHFKRVSCGMTDCQNQGTCFYITRWRQNFGYPLTVKFNSCKFAVKPDFTAVFDNTLTDIPDYVPKIIGSEVRLGDSEYTFRCTEIDKFLQDISTKRVVNSGRELAVRKGSGTAFAELDIGALVELSARPVFGDFLNSLVNRAAAFQNYRLIAVFRENQPGKHSGGSEAGNHDTPVAFSVRNHRRKLNLLEILYVLPL